MSFIETIIAVIIANILTGGAKKLLLQIWEKIKTPKDVA
jgi:hypothetical protein